MIVSGVVCVCVTFSASSLPSFEQTEQKREEPSEECSKEAEEEREMVAQSAEAGAGERPGFKSYVYAGCNSQLLQINKNGFTTLLHIF